MNNIVRAWKDEAYPQSLSAWEQAILPAKPAGEIELTDAELDTVYGAYDDQEDPEIIQRIVSQGEQRAVNSLPNSRVVMTSTGSRSDSDKARDSGNPTATGDPIATGGLLRRICGFGSLV
jgi:mersacidin/lichenicidin family type 2 lantibiotic